MGIATLLGSLSQSFKDVDLRYLRDKTVGVDVSIWIHQGGSQYVYRMVDHLRRNGVKCVLVFDGEELEAKKKILEDRKKRRSELAIQAHKLEKAGKLEEAAKLKTKCYKRTVQTQAVLLEWCRSRGIDYYVSPFEADAQLAYLFKKKKIDVVISDDSDFIVYGVKKILFKFDGYEGELYNRRKLKKTWVDPYKPTCLRAVCILVGCDYFKGGLYSFGIKKAQKLYRKLTEPFNYDEMIEILGQPLDKDDFMRAWNTYAFQLVIDPDTQEIVPLTPYPTGKSDEDFPYAENLQHSIASGKAHMFLPDNPLPELDIGRPMARRTYQCSRCPDQLFASRKALKAHRQNHRFYCDVCHKDFSRAIRFRSHQKEHEPSPSLDFVCQDCGRAFGKYDQLTYHRISHFGKRHVCKVCQKRFLFSGRLQRHMRRNHTGEKPYICRTCSRGFSTSYQLRKHQIFHTKEKSYMCAYCGKCFASASYLRYHEKTQHTDAQTLYSCATCGKRFRHKSNLRTHKKTHQTDRPMLPCTICGKCFTSKHLLQQHETTHKTDRPLFHCSTCGKSFLMKHSVSRHAKTHQTDRQMFPCSICDKSFTTNDYLRVHEASHDPAKQRFKCATCGKGFFNKGQLRRHELSHSTERKCICPHCGKSFKHPITLCRHKKVCPKLVNQEESGDP